MKNGIYCGTGIENCRFIDNKVFFPKVTMEVDERDLKKLVVVCETFSIPYKVKEREVADE